MELAAYLVAWVRSGVFYESRDDHMDKKALPSMQEIEAAMRQEGWL